MIKEKMEKALNRQINEELYSSYLYWAMAAYFESKNLTGFANWTKIQAEEEYLHARKFYDYMIAAGGRVVFDEIKKPKTKWSSIENVFEEILQHEVHITECINDLASLAGEEKDHATASFLKWFIDEQVEELAAAEQILHEVRMVGDNKQGIFMLDREMKARQSIFPSLPSN
ncbi:MAG: ferritin [Sphingobacteriales bacterium]|nr:ferritin [Sphingobacteriales bacterium]